MLSPVQLPQDGFVLSIFTCMSQVPTFPILSSTVPRIVIIPSCVTVGLSIFCAFTPLWVSLASANPIFISLRYHPFFPNVPFITVNLHVGGSLSTLSIIIPSVSLQLL